MSARWKGAGSREGSGACDSVKCNSGNTEDNSFISDRGHWPSQFRTKIVFVTKATISRRWEYYQIHILMTGEKPGKPPPKHGSRIPGPPGTTLGPGFPENIPASADMRDA